jgi:RNA polymerase sigma-70 factor (ECF subfamily)
MAEQSTTQVLQGCLDRLRDGDAAARGELLRCAGERLTRLARKMLQGFPNVRRWEQTDDVLQGALLRLHQSLDRLLPATTRDYFRLAALHIRRQLLDLARHYGGPLGAGTHHESEAEEAERLAVVPADGADDPSRLAVWTEFHQQAEALPEEEREVFDLLWYQGLAQAETATVLGVSERTVKRRWQSARLKLYHALHGELPV